MGNTEVSSSVCNSGGGVESGGSRATGIIVEEEEVDAALGELDAGIVGESLAWSTSGTEAGSGS